jgi:hypothetical protein
MLKTKSAQESFYGSYLYDKIVPQDHLLRKINRVGVAQPTMFKPTSRYRTFAAHASQSIYELSPVWMEGYRSN